MHLFANTERQLDGSESPVKTKSEEQHYDLSVVLSLFLMTTNPC